MTTTSPDRVDGLAAPQPEVPTRRRWRRVRPVARDHARGLLRFVGLTQILGGATLLSGSLADAPAVDLAGAHTALLLIAIAQLVVGVIAAVQPRPLQIALRRWPGRYVAVGLLAATAVAGLGGSNAETSWVTSAQVLLVAAGVALPGLRIIPAALLVSVATSAVWIPLDGPTGGYDADGNYVLAILAALKVFVVGLWVGQTMGAALALLGRWHVIELNERGAIRRLRAQLARVDEKAEALGNALARAAQSSVELAALRVRLRRGVDLPEAGTSMSVEQVVLQLGGEQAAWASPVELHTEIAPDVEALEIDAVVGAEIASVIRRQIDNVARHAPSATRVLLEIERSGGQLRVALTDDGGGTKPARTGGGTAWSARQLSRAGGSTTYFDGPQGVGLEVLLPLHDQLLLSDVPTLSIADGMRRFAGGLFTPLRISGYIGDTLYTRSADGIDDRWLMMPIGAILIEFVIWKGVPGRSMTAPARALLAAFVSALLMLAFTLPPGSPDDVVPATTSVIVPAGLLIVREYRRWLLAEVMRFAAVVPLLVAVGASAITLGVVYPAAFYVMTFGLALVVRRAARLEGSALDAVGRAALASATVRGLALHHDAIDVILRSAPDTPEVIETGAELEDAVTDLANASEPALDPRDLIHGALRAAVLVPLVVTDQPTQGAVPLGPTGVLSSLERIALVEIASLAADERASCTPPGLLGRRRLRALQAEWRRGEGGRAELRLVAEPQLRPPGAAHVQELERVGRALGVAVVSTPEAVVLTYRG
ncbi:MAG: hypothetical protein Q7T55_00880 [Solirubrobacteraceae bacterium]|nr:hypothetical protein [Solirubrobacteraceae bacterium]